MNTVQLRHYRMEPGRLPAFVAWWPSLVPVREQFGFRVLFGYADREHETFTWAVAFDGDEDAFREQEAVYNASAERAAAFESFPAGIAVMEVSFPDDVVARRPDPIP